MDDDLIPDELDHILQEEDHKIEFKSYSKINDSEGVAKELVAFANREGGYLVFGVTDDFQLEGAVIDEDNDVGSYQIYPEWYVTPRSALNINISAVWKAREPPATY